MCTLVFVLILSLQEIFTLVLAASINGDQMSWFNIIGLFVCLSGILVHIIFKAVHGQTTGGCIIYKYMGNIPILFKKQLGSNNCNELLGYN